MSTLDAGLIALMLLGASLGMLGMARLRLGNRTHAADTRPVTEDTPQALPGREIAEFIDIPPMSVVVFLAAVGIAFVLLSVTIL